MMEDESVRIGNFWSCPVVVSGEVGDIIRFFMEKMGETGFFGEVGLVVVFTPLCPGGDNRGGVCVGKNSGLDSFDSFF